MITVDMQKAKNIAHDFRREKRSREFSVFDIKATIPSESLVAEQERQKIREKYAEIQASIDNASSITELKSILNSF